MTAEEERLAQDRDRTAYWKRWGPYLSERQGSVAKMLILGSSIFSTHTLNGCSTLV